MSFDLLRTHVVYDNDGALYERGTSRRFEARVVSRPLGFNLRNAVAAVVLAFDVPDGAERLMVLHRDGDSANLARSNLGAVYIDTRDRPSPLSKWRLACAADPAWLDWVQRLPAEHHYSYAKMDLDLGRGRVDMWFASATRAKQFFHQYTLPTKERKVITPERLAKAFYYDPETGDFWSRKDVKRKGPIRNLWYPKKLANSSPYRLRSAAAGLDVRADSAAAILNYGVNPLDFTTGKLVLLDGNPTNAARNNIACIVPEDSGLGGAPYFTLTTSLRGEIAVRALLLPEQGRVFDRQSDRLDAVFATAADAIVWLKQCGFTSMWVHGMKQREEAPTPEPAPEPLFL